MKGGWYIIAFLAAITVTAADEGDMLPIPTDCDDWNSNEEAIHIAHESDCTKFYKCDGGEKVLKECPPMNKKGTKLHFNPRKQVCDWPASAGCKSKPTPSPVTKPRTRPTPAPVTNPRTRPTRAPITNPRTRPTPAPVTNPRTRPTPAPVTNPRTRPTPAPVTNPTLEPEVDSDTESACPEEDTYQVTYPHPCSCEKYYICKAGDLHLRECPGGLHWNEDAEKCERASKAGCIAKKKIGEWFKYMESED